MVMSSGGIVCKPASHQSIEVVCFPHFTLLHGGTYFAHCTLHCRQGRTAGGVRYAISREVYKNYLHGRRRFALNSSIGSGSLAHCWRHGTLAFRRLARSTRTLPTPTCYLALDLRYSHHQHCASATVTFGYKNSFSVKI